MIERRFTGCGHTLSLVLGIMAAWTATGCGRHTGANDRSGAAAPGAAGGTFAATPPIRRPPHANPDALPAAAPDLSEGRRAWQVVDGQPRLVDADAARAAGLTLVDLSDGWAPLILADAKGADGAPLENRYRAVFVGLSNDKTDGDGQPLGPGERNYLELLGIPPSLSVLRARFLEDAGRTCAAVDRVKLLAVDEIATFGATTEKKEQARHAARSRRLDEARTKAGVADLLALADSDPKLARDVKAHLRAQQERAAFAEVEKRVACEGLMDPARHKAGRYDTVLRAAVLDFQQKHAVMAQGDLNRATLEAMARTPLALDFAALRRVLTERAAHAGAIIEDGSASDVAGAATYLDGDGQRHPVPDLVGEATDRLLRALDLETPEDAVGFFQARAAADFQNLRVPVRFPDRPEYYTTNKPMDLSAEIDRGDIWYDFPFDAKGNRLPQPRERFPVFTLFVKWRGERVPLCRWRTTIGGWRAELASDGQEYYAYKSSDVGPRVWRHLVVSPVWIPPPSSPLGSMVKEKRVNGAFINATNYDETGPGYLSAYGMVAAIHETMRKGKGSEGPTFSDNGIRTHGSGDYLSLRGRFSHGCHRLYNNLAVRVFSFVLAHHRYRATGPMALDYRRTFWWKGDLFDMRLPNRGFYFELEPPIPVETLEGDVRGQQKAPIAGYVPKPGVRYAAAKPPALADTPDSKAGGAEP